MLDALGNVVTQLEITMSKTAEAQIEVQEQCEGVGHVELLLGERRYQVINIRVPENIADCMEELSMSVLLTGQYLPRRTCWGGLVFPSGMLWAFRCKARRIGEPFQGNQELRLAILQCSKEMNAALVHDTFRMPRSGTGGRGDKSL